MDIETLAAELLLNKKNGFFRVDNEEITKADLFCEGYKKFLDNGKTEREATAEAIRLAEEKGFVAYDFSASYQPGDKVYVNNRGKSVVLAVIGKKGSREGVRIAAAHIDCPRIDLKPVPVYETSDFAMLKTHYYGGIKKYQWLAIPLAMHGCVVHRGGNKTEICIGEEPGDPQFCITDLLPHLSREQSSKTIGKAFEGEDLNILFGSRPLRFESGDNLFKLNVMKLLNEKYGIVEQDLITAEIEFVPAYKAVDVGIDRSMIGAYGHDDRVCAYPALQAILDCCVIPEKTIITVLTDKEETGSNGNTGLHSSYLRYFVHSLARKDGVDGHDVLSKSTCLSADVAAAYDPTYACAYEPNNTCYLNKGIGVLKYTGSGGKGGTSDASAEFMEEICTLMEDSKVLWQTGELGRVDLGGGGTVAQFIANLNVDVVDVGVPVLSMHAPFEVVAKLDVYMMYKGVIAYFENSR